MRDADLRFMRQALQLAAGARGRTSPNPMVGAVVVKDGRIVGKGYHVRAGSPHAEVVALARAGELARGATLYVNLEPCCHQGRTPPCVDEIISKGISRVVASVEDPNPVVSGKGLSRLKEAGLKVEVGLLKERAQRLNEAFFKFIRTGRPFVILKGAMSLDGKIATTGGESRWITGEEARRYVHRLRDQVDAILVGVGTILRDDPLLTTRLPNRKGKDPIRVIVDSQARIPWNARVLKVGSHSPTIIAVSEGVSGDRLEGLKRMGAKILFVPPGERGVSLSKLIAKLGEMGIMSLLIEGGGEVNASAIEEALVDKLILFYSPLIIGGKEAPSLIGGKGVDSLNKALPIHNIRVRRFGADLMVEGYLCSQD